MKIIPTMGMAIIAEDKRDYGKTMMDIPDHMRIGLATQGKIIAVTNLLDCSPNLYFEALMNRCPWINTDLDKTQHDDLWRFCTAMERGHEPIPFYREGDHVLFSKFTEQISVYEKGKETIYYSVPVQAILAILQED